MAPSNDESTFLSQAYLDKHKLQLLSSPVSLTSGGDVTGQSGVVTLTSPALLKIKPRSLVICLKFDAVNWKVGALVMIVSASQSNTCMSFSLKFLCDSAVDQGC